MNLHKIANFTCKFQICEGERTEDFFKDRNFFGGWTISDRHPIKGLKRISSNINIANDTVMEIKPAVLRALLEDTIKLYATNKNIIFLSGGKDSTTLAYSFKQLDIPFKAVSLYSKLSPTTELDIVKSIQKELKIDVEYYNIDTIPNTDFKYWIENPYTAKVIAINELGLQNYRIFTGEIGTGEMQVNQSLQYTAMMGYDPQALSYWHVNVCGSYRKLNSVKKLSDDPIYLECVNHFKTRFKQWEVHPDILNRVMFSRLQDEGAYRLFNYGLDNLSWVHPYAENSFIKACVNMPSKYKGKKNLYREMYTDLTDIPWRYPKSGLGIQTV